ncbi:MAG: fumarate hydratase [Endomicrobiia bacterium]
MAIRTISLELFSNTLKSLLIETQYFLPQDVLESIQEFYVNETDTISRDVLNNILQNAKISSVTKLPLCQDTGIPQIFLEIGLQVCFDFDVNKTVAETVKNVYNDEKLRKSCVSDPLVRNTNVHCYSLYSETVDGDKLKISVLIRGGGSENMTTLTTLLPGTTADEIKNFVVDNVIKMLPYTCPPVIVGVGIGGTVDQSMILAKKSLFRDIGKRNKIKFYATMEEMIKQNVNINGCGALGLGGRTSVLDVFVETSPTHIATLPVSIVLQCHSIRRASKVI